MLTPSFLEKSLMTYTNKQINASLPSDTPSPTQKPILVDVREPAELTSTGIIPSAVAVPLATVVVRTIRRRIEKRTGETRLTRGLGQVENLGRKARRKERKQR